MAGRGRKPDMHPPIRPPAPPPAEPAGLSDRESEIFRHIVQSCDADHFAESDMPLLVAYVQAVAQHERAVATLRRDGDVIVNARGSLAISPWITVQEKSSREMIGLALRLRLAP